jgi:hypothetical protein
VSINQDTSEKKEDENGGWRSAGYICGIQQQDTRSNKMQYVYPNDKKLGKSSGYKLYQE